MAGHPEILLEDRDNALDLLCVKILKERDTLPPEIVELAERAEKLDKEYLDATEKMHAEGILD
jgi:hypothetical protein